MSLSPRYPAAWSALPYSPLYALKWTPALSSNLTGLLVAPVCSRLECVAVLSTLRVSVDGCSKQQLHDPLIAPVCSRLDGVTITSVTAWRRIESCGSVGN
ncbi:hypothetical protein BU23DRAFT_180052 [Bimuria novae-zelandiae CBS 107.79]|uniref:Uncharacterized protein n=1 Tax=Bimuria novae-zelandiae CBS 107.79 TaxID=1447943 RepID=A0A6A5V3Y9_9PLEO|nr:hypothetical protein BU23DRAFT_180052 [Bimuria novae-zelandiae CBS 107.79]